MSRNNNDLGSLVEVAWVEQIRDYDHVRDMLSIWYDVHGLVMLFGREIVIELAGLDKDELMSNAMIEAHLKTAKVRVIEQTVNGTRHVADLMINDLN